MHRPADALIGVSSGGGTIGVDIGSYLGSARARRGCGRRRIPSRVNAIVVAGALERGYADALLILHRERIVHPPRAMSHEFLDALVDLSGLRCGPPDFVSSVFPVGALPEVSEVCYARFLTAMREPSTCELSRHVRGAEADRLLCCAAIRTAQ
jgi:hypothetical protein